MGIEVVNYWHLNGRFTGNGVYGGDYYYYIGRSCLGKELSRSILANQYHESKYGRGECIARFKKWLDRKATRKKSRTFKELRWLAARARKGNVKLVCWCVPKDCHGYIIKNRVEKMIEEVCCGKTA